MGITVIPTLFQEESLSAAEKKGKTVGDIRKFAKYYRHPDSALIEYPNVVANPIGCLPKPSKPSDKKIEIAVIGGGASGIASCYELWRLGNSERIKVTLYETDPNHFAITPTARTIDISGKRAGRVFAARSNDDNNLRGPAVYEVGAMRFPETAGLMWHYASVLYGDGPTVDVFPNPGSVPTEFVFADRTDRYHNDVKGGRWSDNNSPTKHVFEVVSKGIAGNSTGKPVSYFKIGGNDPAKITAELRDKNTSEERLHQINEEWKIWARTYDALSLESAVRQVIRGEINELPDINGIVNIEDKINYYAELFGCFGFGTGGFKPIHNISLTEMMRLIIWNYANEYNLPHGVRENVEFIHGLYIKAREKNKDNQNPLEIHVKNARVCDVCHSGDNDKALVFSYDIIDKDGNESKGPPDMQSFDYVILAVPPKQMYSMISRAGYSNDARDVRFGDYGRQCTTDISAKPALRLSNSHDACNAQMYTAIKQIHMVASSKIFVTVNEKAFKDQAPYFGEKEDKNKIQSVISDCGLQSTYLVPSPFYVTNSTSVDEKYVSLLLSYTWEEDTKKTQHHLFKYPLNKDSASPENQLMIQEAINRTIRYVKDPDVKFCDEKDPNSTKCPDGCYKPWWFGKLLSTICLGDPLSHDWTTDYTAGAFKLDIPGGYHNSSLCFRYHTHAINTALKNRFFIASDSYSHLGGWVEGAFMSAVNAVTGLVVAANDGSIDCLNCEAKKVMVTLENVITEPC